MTKRIFLVVLSPIFLGTYILGGIVDGLEIGVDAFIGKMKAEWRGIEAVL